MEDDDYAKELLPNCGNASSLKPQRQMPHTHQTLTSPSGHKIAYRQHKPAVFKPTKRILFLSGFQSSMDGKKASQLAEWAKFQDWEYCRFDYRGHGASEGEFSDFTLQDWLDDTIQVLQHCFDGPTLLVGSSMGSWLAYHVAITHPKLVSGIISIATAPDFIDRYIYSALSQEQQNTLLQQGELAIPSYSREPMKLAFFQTAKSLNLLDRDSLAINCPVHLLHSMQDDIAPWQNSIKIAEKISSDSVRIELVKDGDHSLSRKQDLQRLLYAIQTI